jgi:soluble lytic murein transglycosylase-like protein
MWMRRRLFGRACLVVLALTGSFGVPARAASDGVTVARYATVLRSFNPGFSARASLDMATRVLLLSRYYSLDPRLLVAIVGVESGWHTRATSPAGAQGLGQLMPATANGLAVQSLDPYVNLDGTAR